jgi:hypothetical protein
LFCPLAFSLPFSFSLFLFLLRLPSFACDTPPPPLYYFFFSFLFILVQYSFSLCLTLSLSTSPSCFAKIATSHNLFFYFLFPISPSFKTHTLPLCIISYISLQLSLIPCLYTTETFETNSTIKPSSAPENKTTEKEEPRSHDNDARQQSAFRPKPPSSQTKIATPLTLSRSDLHKNSFNKYNTLPNGHHAIRGLLDPSVRSDGRQGD